MPFSPWQTYTKVGKENRNFETENIEKGISIREEMKLESKGGCTGLKSTTGACEPRTGNSLKNWQDLIA